MTADQWIALLTAVAALLGAIASVIHSRETRSQVKQLADSTAANAQTGDRVTPKE